ncbi:MAG: ATP-binding protein [Methylobacter sp.]
MPVLSSLNDVIVNHAPIGILVFNTEGACIFGNQAAAKIFNTTLNKLKKQNIHRSSWWQNSGLSAAALEVLQSGQGHNFSVPVDTQHSIYIAGTLSRLDKTASPHLLIIFSDISEKMATEQALNITQGIAVDNLKRALIAERKMSYIVEETQRMIGQELHDDLGQHLTGLAYIAENLTHMLQCKQLPEAEEAARITQLIQESHEKTRLLARQLYPQQSNENDLETRLANLLRRIETTFSINCELRYSKIQINNPEVAINMYRIAQEAINNAIKHSNASQIRVSLYSTPDGIVLEVVDNGSGLGDRKMPANGLGMHIMRRRSSMFGGTLHLEEEPGGGTKLTVTLSTQKDLFQ